MSRFIQWCKDTEIPPVWLSRLHLGATGIWAMLVIPTVLLWAESILWVALMSVWANFASHFAAWQASRAEVKQDENGDSS